jgi:hypothetical protein
MLEETKKKTVTQNLEVAARVMKTDALRMVEMSEMITKIEDEEEPGSGVFKTV